MREKKPIVEMPSLSAQFDNHDGFRPEPTAGLAGTEFALHMKDRSIVDVRFDSAGTLSWSSDGEQIWGTSGSERYEAVALRPDDMYLVVVARLEQHTSVLAIVDLAHARVMMNTTRFVDGPTGMQEVTTFGQAGIGGPLTTPFEHTGELAGKRVHHRYSDTHAFEHIYLSRHAYAFQCLEGPEVGLADVDRTDAYKLAESLYLFSWHERVQPFNGAVVLDLEAGRATGRLVGFEPESGRTLQIRTGSIATLLNETSYAGL